MTLLEAKLNTLYQVEGFSTEDEELEEFLLTLGCYKGAKVAVVSQVSGSLVVSIKDGRYTLDKDLGGSILISPVQA